MALDNTLSEYLKNLFAPNTLSQNLPAVNARPEYMSPLSMPKAATANPSSSAFGVPANDITKILGTTAVAISPKSWGGRLGAGAVGLVRENEDQALRQANLGIHQGYYDIAKSKFEQDQADREMISRAREGILGRLREPRGVEDYGEQMSIPAPSYLERMRNENPMAAAAFELETLSPSPNLAPFIKETEPPKLSPHKTVDESGNPIYLNEYGEPTGIPAYVAPKDVEPYKIGYVRPFTVGDKTIYKEYKGKGQWGTMEGLGGPRYKGSTGASGGRRIGGVTDKDAEKYRKNVEAYKREVASLDQQYEQTVLQPEFTGDNKGAILNRNIATENYKKELDKIVRKYRGKIDFVSSSPSSGTQRGLEDKTWTANGKRYRINPETGRTQVYQE